MWDAGQCGDKPPSCHTQPRHTGGSAGGFNPLSPSYTTSPTYVQMGHAYAGQCGAMQGQAPLPFAPTLSMRKWGAVHEGFPTFPPLTPPPPTRV
jgi:hypothetical protein